MIVAAGFDHAGLPLKERIVKAVVEAGHQILDCGAHEVDPHDDYPDFARAVALALIEGKAERGILCCGSGVGVSVAANKIPGVRASMAHDTFSARQGVEDDDMNVLALGARVIEAELAAELVRVFLAAEFSGAERHARRREKVLRIEQDAREGKFDRKGES
jgi:ribose 5-phosphate isomerase B